MTTRKTVLLPEELLQKLRRATGLRTRQAVEHAARDWLRRDAIRRLIALGGKYPKARLPRR